VAYAGGVRYTVEQALSGVDTVVLVYACHLALIAPRPDHPVRGRHPSRSRPHDRPMEPHPWRRRLVVFGPLLVPLFLVATACGDDADDAGGDEADAACEARDELTSSLDDLRELDLTAEGTDALDAAVDDVGDDIAEAADAAQANVEDEVDDVQTAFDELETAIAEADEQDTASGAVSSVSSAVTDVADTVGTLVEALAQECDDGGS